MKTSLRVLQLLALLGSTCLLASPTFATSDDESSTDLTDTTVEGILPTYSTVTLDNLDLFVAYNTHAAITYNGENHAVHVHGEYNLYIKDESYSIEEKNKDAIGILVSDVIDTNKGEIDDVDLSVSATGNSAYGFYHESGGTGSESTILYFRSSDITVEATGDDSDDDVTVAVGVYTEAGTSIKFGLYDLDITVNAYESAAGYGIYNEGGPTDMEVDYCDITVNVEDLSGYGIYINASDDDAAAIYLSDSYVTVTVESSTALGMEYSSGIVPALYLSDVASGLVVDATDRSSDAIHTRVDDSHITAEIKSGTGIATGITILGEARISLYDSHIEATTSAGVSVGVYLESTSDSTVLYTNNTSVTASSTSGTVAAIYAVDSSQSIKLTDTNLYITAQGELYGYALTAGEGLSNLADDSVGGIGIYNLEEDDSSNIIDSYDAYNDINVTSTGSADSGGTSTAYGVYLYKQDSYDNLFDYVKVSADDDAYGLYVFSSTIDTGVTIGTVTVTTTADDAIGYAAYIEDSSISDLSGGIYP